MRSASAVKTRLDLAQGQPANADLNLAADDDMTRWTIYSRRCDCIKDRKN